MQPAFFYGCKLATLIVNSTRTLVSF